MSCPRCGRRVFLVRHNGGTVWFDELGVPWPKHDCLGDSTGNAAAIRAAEERLSAAAATWVPDTGIPDAVWVGLGIIIEDPRGDCGPEGARPLPLFADSVVVLTSDGKTLFVEVLPEQLFEVGQLLVVRREHGEHTIEAL